MHSREQEIMSQKRWEVRAKARECPPNSTCHPWQAFTHNDTYEWTHRKVVFVLLSYHGTVEVA